MADTKEQGSFQPISSTKSRISKSRLKPKEQEREVEKGLEREEEQVKMKKKLSYIGHQYDAILRFKILKICTFLSRSPDPIAADPGYDPLNYHKRGTCDSVQIHPPARFPGIQTLF